MVKTHIDDEYIKEMYYTFISQPTKQHARCFSKNYTTDFRMLSEFSVICKKIPNFSGKKILDIGTGWGWLCVNMNKRGGLPIGISPVKYGCKIAAFYNSINDCQSPIICATGSYLPFANETFDIIFCLDVLEHITKKRHKHPCERAEAKKVLEEALRLLAPRGRIIVTVPNGLFPIELHSRLPVTYMPKFLRNRIINSPFISNCSEPPEVYTRKTLFSLFSSSQVRTIYLNEELVPETDLWSKGLLSVFVSIIRISLRHFPFLSIILGTELLIIAEKT